jgi:hypothetical protein
LTGRLDREMIGRIARRGWWLPALGATGPAPSLARSLELFGRFVGEWTIYPGGPARSRRSSPRPIGTVSVRWVLGGTAVQDVWGPVDGGSGRTVPVGTTVRFYDRKLRAWRSTWICPYDRSVRRFLGREERGRVVLRELDGSARQERWIFSEITAAGFRWHAEARPRRGAPRRVIEEYVIRRTPRGARWA